MNRPAYLANRPTYTLEQIEEAKAAWDDFSDEWSPWRQMAATGPGIIYPPDGTKWDQWDDAHPSQRAMLIRAIRETPDLLRWAIRGVKSPSWSSVIERWLAGWHERSEQVSIDEAAIEAPVSSDDVKALSRILSRCPACGEAMTCAHCGWATP